MWMEKLTETICRFGAASTLLSMLWGFLQRIRTVQENSGNRIKELYSKKESIVSLHFFKRLRKIFDHVETSSHTQMLFIDLKHRNNRGIFTKINLLLQGCCAINELSRIRRSFQLCQRVWWYVS